METARTIAELRARLDVWRRAGETIGLVPTMGGLHEGHLSLVRDAKSRADHVVASLFVNPTQFAPNEDFDAYPRDESADSALFTEEGVEVLFAPDMSEIYPDGHTTQVEVRGMSQMLEGEFRPHFFIGVATVVAKLLVQAWPDVAVFGEKDYQQLQIITRMARDMDIPTRIIGAPTIREADGLAMSSRNRYLSSDERRAAPALYAAINDVARASATGEDVAAATDAAEQALLTSGFRQVDYVTVRDAETLEPWTGPPRPGRVLAAAWLGKARLIDNVPVGA